MSHIVIARKEPIYPEFKKLSKDYVIHHTTTAQETLEQVSRSADVVVLDVDSPVSDMPLEQLIKEIRARDPFLAMILEVKGYGVYEAVLPKIVSYIQAGVQQFIQIPSGALELTFKLTSAMEQTYLARVATGASQDKSQNRKDREELFVQLMEKRLAAGIPISSQELDDIFPKIPADSLSKNQLLEKLNTLTIHSKETADQFTILTVDDEPKIRSVLRDMLFNFKVIEAENVDQGLDIIKKQPVQIVLLDISMPGKSGDSWVAEYRKASPNTDVVMLTGQADYELIFKTLSAGASDYVIKPPKKVYLKAVILKILQKQIFKSLGNFVSRSN